MFLEYAKFLFITGWILYPILKLYWESLQFGEIFQYGETVKIIISRNNLLTSFAYKYIWQRKVYAGKEPVSLIIFGLKYLCLNVKQTDLRIFPD